MIFRRSKLVLFLVATLATAATSPAVTDPEWRFYDLHGISSGYGINFGPSGMDSDHLGMMPFVSENDFRVDEQEVEWIQPLDVETVIQILSLVVFPEQWESGDVKVDVVHGKNLMVYAAEDFHSLLADVLGWLHGAAVSQQLLEIRLLSDFGPMPLPSNSPVVLDYAEADRRAQALVQAGAKWRQQGPVRLATDAVVRSESHHDVRNFIYDWEVDIAEASFVWHPVSESMAFGVTVLAKSAPYPGGTYVDFLVRDSEESEGQNTRTIHTASQIVAESGATYRTISGNVLHPQIAFTSMASSVVIPDGKAIWIPATIDTQSGRRSWVIDLRVRGPQKPSGPFRFQRQGENYAIDLFSLMSATSGGVSVSSIHNRLLDTSDYFGSPLMQVGQQHGRMEMDVAADIIAETFDVHADDRTALEVLQGSRLFTLLTEEVYQQARSLAHRIGDAGPVRSAQIQITDETGREIARSSLPWMNGRMSALWIGFEGTFLNGWDGLAANNSAAADPSFRSFFDGVAVNLRVTAVADSTFQVELNADTRLLAQPPRTQNLDAPMTPVIDEVRHQTLHIDDVRLVQPGESMKWSGQGLRFHLVLR